MAYWTHWNGTAVVAVEAIYNSNAVDNGLTEQRIILFRAHTETIQRYSTIFINRISNNGSDGLVQYSNRWVVVVYVEDQLLRLIAVVVVL